MSLHRTIHIDLVDPHNPSCGYQIRISDAVTGRILLLASNHPATGIPLDLENSLKVAVAYGYRGKSHGDIGGSVSMNSRGML